MEISKKVLASIFIIGLLALGLGWGTHSWFSDTETSKNNYFIAGTMDLELSVGAGYVNPWSGAIVTLEDMKPCEWEYKKVWLHNGGDNPGSAWMHIFNVRGEDYINTDAEIEAGGIGVYDIYNWITFDLKVDGTVIIHPDDHIKLGDIRCCWIPLGDMDPSDEIIVELSFHLQEETDNRYQGDRCLFDMEFFLNQMSAPPPESHRILLENKDDSWNPIIGDGKWGIVEYDTSSLSLTVWAHGLTENAYHQICLNSQPAHTGETKKIAIASALASDKYDGTSPGTAPPTGYNLYQRLYWAGAPATDWSDGAEGIFNVAMFAQADGTGYLYDSRSVTLPSGEYDAVKLIIKEAIGADPTTDDYGDSWPPRLMECWIPLYFTIP